MTGAQVAGFNAAKAVRLALRPVFDGRLMRDRNSGLATPSLSLPAAVCCVPELDALEVVDMVRRG